MPPPPLPPPPPPPPPPASKDRNLLPCKHGKMPLDSNVTDPRERLRKQLSNLLDRHGHNVIIQVHLKTCQPLLQDGPMCGLIALSMAGEILTGKRPPLEKIMKTASDLTYTKQGEMFSAKEMGDLAEKILTCNALVSSDACRHRHMIMEQLTCGNVVLVPYDADGNHEPCLKNGKKAHWAVLIGIAFLVNKLGAACVTGNHYQQDPEMPQIFYSITHTPLADTFPDSHVYVLALQGKSRHIGIWSLDDLLASNANLEELDPKIVDNIGEYVVPIGGPAAGLKEQIVYLSKI